MKIEIENHKPVFNPIKVTLTLESQSEADVLFVLGFINKSTVSAMRKILNEMESDLRFDSDVATELFSSFFNKF